MVTTGPTCIDTIQLLNLLIGANGGIYVKTGGNKGGVIMNKLLLPVDGEKLSERTLDYVKEFSTSVSYTHLTLPTNREV